MAKQEFPAPPHLQKICSVSCSMSARAFFAMLQKAKVEVLLDTRKSRRYRGYDFNTSLDDTEYLCELHSIKYVYASDLAPTDEMRSWFHQHFSEADPSRRDALGWTKYLEQYEALLKARKPLRRSLKPHLYGEAKVIAVMCSCGLHDDCHRSYAAGLISTMLPSVELEVLYPGGVAPKPAYPRRYRYKDFAYAGLFINGRA